MGAHTKLAHAPGPVMPASRVNPSQSRFFFSQRIKKKYHSVGVGIGIKIIYYYFSRVFTPRLSLALAGKHKAIAHRILLRFFHAQQRQFLRRAHVRDVFLEALGEDEIDLLERAPARLGVE